VGRVLLTRLAFIGNFPYRLLYIDIDRAKYPRGEFHFDFGGNELFYYMRLICSGVFIVTDVGVIHNIRFARHYNRTDNVRQYSRTRKQHYGQPKNPNQRSVHTNILGYARANAVNLNIMT
jgi:hypothetical protein